jgi:hypothetical protein
MLGSMLVDNSLLPLNPISHKTNRQNNLPLILVQIDDFIRIKLKDSK